MAETSLDLGSSACFQPRLEEFREGRARGKGGGYMIVCSHKYTKLAAYQLISVHDPSEIFSVLQGRCLY